MRPRLQTREPGDQRRPRNPQWLRFGAGAGPGTSRVPLMFWKVLARSAEVRSTERRSPNQLPSPHWPRGGGPGAQRGRQGRGPKLLRLISGCCVGSGVGGGRKPEPGLSPFSPSAQLRPRPPPSGSPPWFPPCKEVPITQCPADALPGGTHSASGPGNGTAGWVLSRSGPPRGSAGVGVGVTFKKFPFLLKCSYTVIHGGSVISAPSSQPCSSGGHAVP